MRCGFYAGNSKALLCLWIRLSHDSENLKGTASSSCSGCLSGTHAGDWKKEKKGVIFSRDTLYHLIYCWDYRQLKGEKKNLTREYESVPLPLAVPSCCGHLFSQRPAAFLYVLCCLGRETGKRWLITDQHVCMCVSAFVADVTKFIQTCCVIFFFFELLAPFSVINHVMAKQIWEVLLLYLLKLFF